MALRPKKKQAPKKDSGADKDGVVKVRGRFGRVVTFFDAFDVGKESAAVLEAVERVVDKDDTDALKLETEAAARLTYKAATLADLAKREYRDVKTRVETTMAVWREAAQEYLAVEKAAKRVVGQVTVSMVTDTVSITQPQPYADLMTELHDAEMMRENMAHLYEMARERMWNLRSLSGFRGTAYEGASAETRRGEDW